MTTVTAPNPCPFCGNADLTAYRLDYHGDKWCIRCDDPRCFVKPHNVFDVDLGKSIRMWNQRAA